MQMTKVLITVIIKKPASLAQDSTRKVCKNSRKKTPLPEPKTYVGREKLKIPLTKIGIESKTAGIHPLADLLHERLSTRGN